jgi:hypothetical protein
MGTIPTHFDTFLDRALSHHHEFGAHALAAFVSCATNPVDLLAF